MSLKQTPLNAVHREMGAKLVDFGGWDMPLHYGSQIEEHHQVRRDVGMFDVCHMRVVDVQGEGARNFLTYLLANNPNKLQVVGHALYSAMLNPEGGVIDDLIVYYLSEQHFRAVVNAGRAEVDIAWMRTQAKEMAPQIKINERSDLGIIAIQGPNARTKVWQVLPQIKEATEALKPFYAVEQGQYFVARTGYTGEEGFEVVLPKDEVVAFWQVLHQAGVQPIGLGARDTLRLEAGLNLYGQDMDEQVSPLEAGLAWTVDLQSERDFIGKAALLEQTVSRKLVGLVLLDKGVLRNHQVVKTAQGEGEITSGTFAPTIEKSIAFARVPKEVSVGDRVQIAVRDKLLNAEVVKYPFVRNGKVLI